MEIPDELIISLAVIAIGSVISLAVYLVKKIHDIELKLMQYETIQNFLTERAWKLIDEKYDGGKK